VTGQASEYKSESTEAPQSGVFHRRGSRPLRQVVQGLLIFVVVNGIIINSANILTTKYLINHQRPGWQYSTLYWVSLFARHHQGTDSMWGMLTAIAFYVANPKASIYDAIFYKDHIKFQYSLASLLPYYKLTQWGATYGELHRISTISTWFSVWITLFITVIISMRVCAIDYRKPRNWLDNALLVFTVAVAVIFFNPLSKGFGLGQIQTLLTLGFTISFYCWMTGREKTAGALIGIMALVKPQYALFLLWVLLRKRYGALMTCAGFLLAGTLVSCLVFGWHNNWEYVGVLRTIGRLGECYLPNQSMNGLLNRLLFNGNTLAWDPHNFAPYHPIVYAGTLLTSILLIGFSLFFPWADRLGGVADFACFGLAATMASPVAWDHHYGILVPILAWLWFGDYAWRNQRREVILIGVAYFLTSNVFVPASFVAAIPLVNVLQSYVYIGSLLLILLLVRSRGATFQSEELATA
jgi:alpha-1,2-mannosyltransferase